MFGIEVMAEFVEEKIAIFGANAIMGAVARTPLGFALEVAGRFSEFIESEGISELDRIAAGELHKLEHPLKFKFKGRALIKKMQDVFSEPVSARKALWQRGGWAMSQQDWLANEWEHDWRSQPRVPAGSSTTVSTVRGERHAGGEWTFGRMGSPFVGSTAIGKGKPKTSRNRRRLRRYRRYGRLAARDAMKG
jgi:hypothetical protein